MSDIYEDWADTLNQMSLGAINYAIETSRDEQHPPSLGEFVAHCRKYAPPIPLMIEKMPDISKEEALENIAKLKEIIRKSRIANAD